MCYGVVGWLSKDPLKGLWMSLVSRLSEPSPMTRCQFGQLLASLPPDEQAAVTVALADSSYSNGRLVAAFHDEGYHAGQSTLRLHRLGRCRCVRQEKNDA